MNDPYPNWGIETFSTASAAQLPPSMNDPYPNWGIETVAHGFVPPSGDGVWMTLIPTEGLKHKPVVIQPQSYSSMNDPYPNWGIETVIAPVMASIIPVWMTLIPTEGLKLMKGNMEIKLYVVWMTLIPTEGLKLPGKIISRNLCVVWMTLIPTEGLKPHLLDRDAYHIKYEWPLSQLRDWNLPIPRDSQNDASYEWPLSQLRDWNS